MIKYDYTLKRDEEDVIKTYKPKKIPSKLPNLVYIEGPNSSGKSTLLHVIALGCHGIRNSQIKRSLQEKIKNILDSGHQDISFKIEITNDDNSLELVSEKKDLKGNTIVLRDGTSKIITSDQFQKKYNLIYDIPENPTKRLHDLTDGIKNMQLRFDNKLGHLRSHLLKIITDIQEAKNPQKIRAVTNEINVFNENKTNLKKVIDAIEKRLKEVKLFTCIKYYIHHDNRIKELKEQRKQVKKKEAENKKTKKKISGQAAILKKSISDEIDIVETNYYEATPLLETFFSKGKEKNNWSLWKKIIVKEELAQPDIKQDLKYVGSHFRDLLEKEFNKQQKEGGWQEATVFREIIEVLESYENLKIKIPVVEVSISKFIDILRKESKKYENLIDKNTCLKNIIGRLGGILKKREYIVNELLPKLKSIFDHEADTKVTVDDYTNEYQIEKLDRQISERKDDREHYKAECSRMDVHENNIAEFYKSIVLGRPLKELNEYEETQLRDKIYDMEKELSKKREELSKTEGNLEYLDKELRTLEKKEPHPHHVHLGFLKEVVGEIQIMAQKMNNFESYIKQLGENSYNPNDDLQERNKYFDNVFCYLGKKVGSIRHIDENYIPTKINLIEKVIFTESGKNIRIDDLSTGQGQSAYLKGLLEVDDKRKIIALFDEVAMMDKQSLAPIYEKLKELNKNKRLLVGIIVQKAEKISVNPIS